MSEKLRGPKMEVEDVRLRFEDYIGQPWNGLKWSLDAAMEGGSKDRVQEMWNEIFRRVRAFLDSDFEPSGAVTRENLERMLEFESTDPFNPDVVERWEELWNSVRKKQE